MILPLVAAALVQSAGTPPPPAALSPGTISIAPAGQAEAATRPAFDDAVQRALSNAGFTPLPQQGHGRYVATLTVTRTPRGVVTAERARGAPPRASLNGGLSVGLPAGGERLGELVVTRLTVVIALRSDPRVRWSGSAVTARVSGTPTGTNAAVAQTLADAAMARFPAQLDAPVSVP